MKTHMGQNDAVYTLLVSKQIGFRKEMLTFQKHILNKSKLIELVVDFSFELQ